MNLILDDLVQILITGLIPFLRISALLLAAPLVSLRVVTVRIRIALAIVLTAFIFPMLDLPVIDATSAAGIRLIVHEHGFGYGANHRPQCRPGARAVILFSGAIHTDLFIGGWPLDHD